VVDRTVQGGAAVVELLQTGSAFYAPASSIVQMVEEILHPSGRTLSVCARLEGEYGIDGVYVCVPAQLGRGGVERLVEIDLAPKELQALQASADSSQAQVTAVL
jgi:malate dehydrogenase